MAKFIFLPRCSMYGIFTYIWVIIRANVGKYTIHGAYGLVGASHESEVDLSAMGRS
jgi:hypothetical protein